MPLTLLNSVHQIKSLLFTREPSASLRARLAHGVSWSLAGNLLSQAVAMLSLVVVARIIGKSEFGRFSLIQTTVTMFATLAGLGLGSTATKFVAEFRESEPKRAGQILGFTNATGAFSCALLGLALVALAPVLARSALGSPTLATSLRVSSLLLFFTAFNNIQTGVLAGFEAFRQMAKTYFARAVAILPATALGAFFASTNGALVGLIIVSVVSCLLNYANIRNCCRAFAIHPDYRNAKRHLHLIGSFSTPTLLGSVITAGAAWTATAALARQTGGFSELGAFNAAFQWRVGIALFPTLLSQPILPILSNMFGNRDRRFSRLTETTAMLIGATVIPLVAVVSLMSAQIMGAYGQGFAQHRVVLCVLAAATICTSVSTVFNFALTGSGNQWSLTAVYAVWAFTLMLASSLLTKPYGALGLGASYALADLCHLALSFAIFRRRIKPCFLAESSA